MFSFISHQTSFSGEDHDSLSFETYLPVRWGSLFMFWQLQPPRKHHLIMVQSCLNRWPVPTTLFCLCWGWWNICQCLTVCESGLFTEALAFSNISVQKWLCRATLHRALWVRVQWSWLAVFSICCAYTVRDMAVVMTLNLIACHNIMSVPSAEVWVRSAFITLTFYYLLCGPQTDNDKVICFDRNSCCWTSFWLRSELKMIVTLTHCKNGYLFTLENKVGSHYFLLKTQVVLATPNISDCSNVVPKQTRVVKLSCRLVKIISLR